MRLDKVFCEENRRRAETFFMGPLYPIIVCALVVLGYITALEFYFNTVFLLMLSVGLVVSHSVRPFIVVLLTYIYQLSIEHCPSMPAHSDYYFTGARFVIIVLMFVLVGVALVFFFIKNRIFGKDTLKSLPILIPSAVLASAFLLNGAFGGAWSGASLAYGVMQLIGFFAVFYIFYLGFKNEDGKELLDYFVYVSALVALVLVIETVYVYISGGVIVDGSAVKDKIVYGWGIWNTAGQAMTVTIPVLFYGVMRGRRPWFYFAVATVTLVAVLMTLSRSSLIFSCLGFLVGCILCCFFGERKRAFRIIVPAGAGGVLLLAFVLRDKILSLLSDLVNRGFSDNGRYELWSYAVDSFLEAPVFGKGFFGLVTDTFVAADFLPPMIHNTPLQLLAAMGAVGLVAYIYYRAETVRLFIKNPTLGKSMIAISLITLLGQSLLDNYIFYIHPMFYYSIALAVVCRQPSDEEL